MDNIQRNLKEPVQPVSSQLPSEEDAHAKREGMSDEEIRHWLISLEDRLTRLESHRFVFLQTVRRGLLQIVRAIEKFLES